MLSDSAIVLKSRVTLTSGVASITRIGAARHRFVWRRTVRIAAEDHQLGDFQAADFGVLACTRDDHILNEDWKGDASEPRENVILELGMCIGALGRKRGYMVIPRSKTAS